MPGVSSYPARSVTPGRYPARVDRDHDDGSAMADLDTARDWLDMIGLALISFATWAMIELEALGMRILTRHL